MRVGDTDIKWDGDDAIVNAQRVEGKRYREGLDRIRAMEIAAQATTGVVRYVNGQALAVVDVEAPPKPRISEHSAHVRKEMRKRAKPTKKAAKKK